MRPFGPSSLKNLPTTRNPDAFFYPPVDSDSRPTQAGNLPPPPKCYSSKSSKAELLMAGDLSISDATAVEGSGQVNFLDMFVPAHSGGSNDVRGIAIGPHDGHLYVGVIRARYCFEVRRSNGRVSRSLCRSLLKQFANGRTRFRSRRRPVCDLSGRPRSAALQPGHRERNANARSPCPKRERWGITFGPDGNSIRQARE